MYISAGMKMVRLQNLTELLTSTTVKARAFINVSFACCHKLGIIYMFVWCMIYQQGMTTMSARLVQYAAFIESQDTAIMLHTTLFVHTVFAI